MKSMEKAGRWGRAVSLSGTPMRKALWAGLVGAKRQIREIMRGLGKNGRLPGKYGQFATIASRFGVLALTSARMLWTASSYFVLRFIIGPHDFASVQRWQRNVAEREQTKNPNTAGSRVMGWMKKRLKRIGEAQEHIGGQLAGKEIESSMTHGLAAKQQREAYQQLREATRVEKGFLKRSLKKFASLFQSKKPPQNTLVPVPDPA